MNKYIAFLRGINVSGQKKIKMADLRQLLEKSGLRNVQSYIQSGNLIFESEKDPPALVDHIQDLIQNKYQFDVVTIVRRREEIQSILDNNPFTTDSTKIRERMYFTLLAENPDDERLKLLADVDHSPEEFDVNGKTIYFYAPNGYGRAKMNNNFFENKLKVKATTRNLKTMLKMLELT